MKTRLFHAETHFLQEGVTHVSLSPTLRQTHELPRTVVFVRNRFLGGAAAAPGEGKPTTATEASDAAPKPMANGWALAACVSEATSATTPAPTHEEASGQASLVEM